MAKRETDPAAIEAARYRKILSTLRAAAAGGDRVSGALVELARRKAVGYRTTRDLLDRLSDGLDDAGEEPRDAQ